MHYSHVRLLTHLLNSVYVSAYDTWMRYLLGIIFNAIEIK